MGSYAVWLPRAHYRFGSVLPKCVPGHAAHVHIGSRRSATGGERPRRTNGPRPSSRRASVLCAPPDHSENLAMQEQTVRYVEEEIVSIMPPYLRPLYKFALGQARHRDIIASLGSRPHRNAMLSHTSTLEELEYLSGPPIHTRLLP